MIVLELPWWPGEYRHIDICLLAEIITLWSMGIKTCFNCCGHNIGCGEIMVKKESIKKMRELDYLEMPNSFPGTSYPVFFARSTPLIPLKKTIAFMKAANKKNDMNINIDGIIESRKIARSNYKKNPGKYSDYIDIENL